MDELADIEQLSQLPLDERASALSRIIAELERQLDEAQQPARPTTSEPPPPATD